MDALPVRLGDVLVERVDAGLGGPPVELVAPVGEQIGEVAALGALVPARTLDLVRQPGAGEAVAQVLQDGVRDVDPKRGALHRGHGDPSRR